VHLVGGYLAALYQPRFLISEDGRSAVRQRLFNKTDDFPMDAGYFVDDDVISGELAMAHVPRMVCPRDFQTLWIKGIQQSYASALNQGDSNIARQSAVVTWYASHGAFDQVQSL